MHAKRSHRISSRGSRFGHIGDEPPLSLDRSGAPDRRRVNLRWLTGTILTGVCGATLMGAAIYTALGGEYTFARAPLAAAVVFRDAAGSQSNISEKADKAISLADDITARQILRVSTTTKVGDKDVIKVKPFAHILANLQLSRGPLADQVPEFNPGRLINGAEIPQSSSAETALLSDENLDEAEVTVTTRSLGETTIAAESGLILPIEEVRKLVVEQASFEANAVSVVVPPQLLDLDMAINSDLPGVASAYAVEGIDARSGPDVQVLAENVTDMGKTAAANDLLSGEKTVLVEKDETLSSILQKHGATADEAEAIASTLGSAAAVREGQRLRILIAPETPTSDRKEPLRVSIYTADAHEGSVALSDMGEYVSIEDPRLIDNQAVAEQGGEEETKTDGVPLYHSIYETAMNQQVPKETVDSILRVYAYDVDLNRRTRRGDTIELFYASDEDGKPQGEVLYSALTVGAERKRYYRFVTEDGQADYYDQDGRSAEKFLMRKPLQTARMTSPFGLRVHPLHKSWRQHNGVDWAAPIGTPILATGDGVILKAGWAGGYGKHIEIQHANGYVTTYSHMSGFADKIKPGTKVVLGQTIGYVGSTGASTGAHCHYEVRINGAAVDPMRIKLPEGRELDERMLAAFKEERDRIDAMMTTPPTAQNVAQAGG